jgi:hypothetical protein
VQNKVNTAGGNCYTSKGWLLAGNLDLGTISLSLAPSVSLCLKSEKNKMVYAKHLLFFLKFWNLDAYQAEGAYVTGPQ